MTPGRHRRRVGWRPGVAADRRPPSRDGGRPGHLVDQRRRLRPPLAGDALLRRVASARPGPTGMEAVADAARVGRGAGAATRRTASASWTRTRRRSSRRWSAGCWPTAPATTSTCPACPTPTPGRSTSRRWSSAAAAATPTTPGPPRRRWPSFCRRRRLVEPPWGDREWIERQERTGRGAVRPLAPAGPAALGVAGRSPGLTGGPARSLSPSARPRRVEIALARAGHARSRRDRAPSRRATSAARRPSSKSQSRRSLHEPHLGEAVGHGAEPGGGDRRGRVVGRPARVAAGGGWSRAICADVETWWRSSRMARSSSSKRETCSITPMMRASSR